eukprot:jgi/Botrbrau1/10852/Bobra.0025s0030.1
MSLSASSRRVGVDVMEIGRNPTDASELKGKVYRDPESLEDVPLVPGISKLDNQLRWGFIKKVYGIIASQLVLTAIVAGTILASPPVRSFVTSNAIFQITFALLPLVGLIPLYIYQRSHPHNLIILGLWTVCISVGVGSACTLYEPAVVLEALVITAAVVTALTVYTFHAARKGVKFGFLAPVLLSGLSALVLWSFIQLFLPVGPLAKTIFALFGAVIFSMYVVFDTHMLIERYELDDYIWASVNLYLDIINLFLEMMRILGNNRN